MRGERPLTVAQRRKKALLDTPPYKTKEQICLECDKPAIVCKGNCEIFRK